MLARKRYVDNSALSGTQFPRELGVMFCANIENYEFEMRGEGDAE